jgi:hypothetical protein
MFERANEFLTIQKCETADGVALTVSGSGSLRSFPFRDEAALDRFRRDMEQFLIRTGWTLHSCTPDRRSVGDRRTFPRITVDRRRWWTDGLSQPIRRSRKGARRDNRGDVPESGTVPPST